MRCGGGKQISDSYLAKPFISIVMATFNAENVLEDAIKSIISNSSNNTELIVVDGESKDGTLNILQKYNNNITKWVSEPDLGIYDALNKGVKIASGQWVYFMGADDRLLRGFKKMAMHLIHSNTLYYGNAESNGPIFEGEFSKYRLAKYCINHQTIFYPRKVFNRYRFNNNFPVHADYAFNMACWGDNTIKKKFYPITIAFYNSHGYSSKTNDNYFSQNKMGLIKEHLGIFVFYRFLIKRFRERKNAKGLFKSVNH